jgi:hypothetical protein
MSFAKHRPGPLTSRIGRIVTFSSPKDVAKRGGARRTGTIVDEVWANEAVNRRDPRKLTKKDDWGDYSFCAQLIEWDDDPDVRSIRLGYFRRRAGEQHWEFAAQMSSTSDVKTMERLFKKTLKKSEWFLGASARRKKKIGSER